MVGRIVIVGFCLGLLPSCNNCEALEARICEDLGAEDCQLWREGKGPETLVTGRRAERGCFNARFNPMQYDPHLTGAKAIADAIRKSKQAAKR
jgi:hypothetical protein